MLGFLLAHMNRIYIENSGEFLVNAKLKRDFPFDDYHLLKNITLPTEDGGSTQIDHVLVSRYGIFVIETKNYSGWIFGNGRSRKWTQSIYGTKNSFQNPLHQNVKHVNELQKLFDFLPEGVFKSVVVFTDKSHFKTKLPENVMHLSSLSHHINQFNEELISANRVYFIVGKIEVLRHEVSKATDKAHVEYLANKFAGNSYS